MTKAYNFIFEGKNNEYDEEYKDYIEKENVEMDKFDKSESGFYDSIKLHPIGVMPEYIWIEHRIQDISEAIIRYAEVGLDIPKEWYEERNKHINWLKWRGINGHTNG